MFFTFVCKPTQTEVKQFQKNSRNFQLFLNNTVLLKFKCRATVQLFTQNLPYFGSGEFTVRQYSQEC